MEEGRLVVAAGEGEVVLRSGFGVVGKVSGAQTGGAFSVVEHPLEPKVLGAPPHAHANEDETSFVIEGEIGLLIGDEEFRATAGSYVFKPRGVPHAFWNPGPEPARILEIISPAGFERYFGELAGVLSAGGRPTWRGSPRSRVATASRSKWSGCPNSWSAMAYGRARGPRAGRATGRRVRPPA